MPTAKGTPAIFTDSKHQQHPATLGDPSPLKPVGRHFIHVDNGVAVGGFDTTAVYDATGKRRGSWRFAPKG